MKTKNIPEIVSNKTHLITLRNRIAERRMGIEIDIEFFKKKSLHKNFTAKDKQHFRDQCEQKIEEEYWDAVLLEIIDTKIQGEK